MSTLASTAPPAAPSNPTAGHNVPAWAQPCRRLAAEELRELEQIVGKGHVLHRPAHLLSYECDATTVEKMPPAAVVFVHDSAQVQAVVRWCQHRRIPYLPRGAGTGLSGGALASQGGLIIEMARLKRLIEVDEASGLAVLEPGVVNLQVTKAVCQHQLYFAPDPSSQAACTLGGNLAENSGGPHTLKYGVTTNHVLGAEVIMPDGERVRLGGECRHLPGYDMIGLFCGSEGTFGIATEITVRLLRQPEAVKTLLASFRTVRDATRTVSAITADGMIPAALEMIDGFICRAVEGHLKVGLPLDAEAVLLIELDGLQAGQDQLAERIMAICRRHDCMMVRVAKDDKERAGLWKARKGAFGAVGLISPSFYTHDGVIPRSKLPEVLDKIAGFAAEYGLQVCNVFHAGDGNLHPLVLFDDRDPEQLHKAHLCGEKILRTCVEVGGSLTGEHGIGLEKLKALEWLFDAATLAHMCALRDCFNPDGLCNPGKAVAMPGGCVETKKHYGSVRYA